MNRCALYPESWEDSCVCQAGSDVSGIDDPYVCSEEYSENCPWFREWLKENFPEFF